MITGLVIGGAALAVYLWPDKPAGEVVRGLVPKAAPVKFSAAIAALSLVQHRLSTTDCLDDDQREAIDTLTLALVRGSVEE
jgi:hypothetical protein